MECPDTLLYTDEHEWVRVDGDLATVGITDFAQEALGDVVFVELPAAGSTVTAGKPFGVVESVKAVSDLCAPLTGTVEEINEALVATPELINSSPYGEAWLIRVRPADPGQLAGLLDAASYRVQLQK